MFDRFLVIFTTLMLFSHVSLADYGSGAVNIVCDKADSKFRINTYIKWNEEYDEFKGKHPLGFYENAGGATYLLDSLRRNKNFKADYQCQIEDNLFKVSVYVSGHFDVFNDKEELLFRFEDIYPSDNDVYGLGSTITNYYLEIDQEEKIKECVTRRRVGELCSNNIVNQAHK